MSSVYDHRSQATLNVIIRRFLFPRIDPEYKGSRVTDEHEPS